MSATSKYKSTPTYSFKGWNKGTLFASPGITDSNDLKNYPSPLHYNPEQASPSKMKNSPSIRFAKSQRKDWDPVRQGPGPGSHETISYITVCFKLLQDGPKKTINRTRFQSSINRTPDPGQYHNDSLLFKKKSPSFSMQKKTLSARDLTIQKNVGKPSPGQYEQPVIKFHSSLISIGKSKRLGNELGTKTPGPGSYDSE